jgi:hypothetical protein
MKFGQAFDLAVDGARITARGWNGKGMWFAVEPGDPPAADPPIVPPVFPLYTGPDLGVRRPHLYLSDAQGHRVPWTPSQTDLFRDDYELAPGFWDEPVAAWGGDAVARARETGALLVMTGDDGDPYPDGTPEDVEEVRPRWVYVPVAGGEP